VRRILRNPKYRGQLVWGRTQQSRKPGSRTKVVRWLPEAQWHTVARAELRIISEELWARVQARHREAATDPTARQPGRTLMQGGNAKRHSETLFSGFMTCGICGRAVNVVGSHHIKGVTYRYYGCAHASKNGPSACTNRVKVRMELADRALLAGLQAELLRPETVHDITEQLAIAFAAVNDQRPAERADLEHARHVAEAKLRNLIGAVEQGAGTPVVFQAIRDREAEIRAVDGRLGALRQPTESRLAVGASWVRQQLADVADLIGDVPERAKAEFRRLNVGFVLHPVHNEGTAPFLRAVGSGDFEHLAGHHAALPTAVSSHLR
jgi:hypothetical protein